MKVLFLDIDGVLNSVDSSIAFSNMNRNIFKNEMRLDPVSIGLLRSLCVGKHNCDIETHDVKIVISSTWRLGRTVQDFIDIFTLYGWDNCPIIGKTKVLNNGNRGDEIQEWLDSKDIEYYVILDDDSDMLDSQLNNFVHVSNINGFRSQHYCKALRILGYPDERLESQVNFKRID